MRRTRPPSSMGRCTAPLIRATLPRVEGQKEVRTPPDFTARHIPARGAGHGGFRGDRDRMRMRGGSGGAGNGNGNGNSHGNAYGHGNGNANRGPGLSSLPGQPSLRSGASVGGRQGRRRPRLPQREWQREREQARSRFPGLIHTRTNLRPPELPRKRAPAGKPLRPAASFVSFCCPSARSLFNLVDAHLARPGVRGVE